MNRRAFVASEMPVRKPHFPAQESSSTGSERFSIPDFRQQAGSGRDHSSRVITSPSAGARSNHSGQSSPNSSLGCSVRIVPFPQARSVAGQYLSHPQQMRSGWRGFRGTGAISPGLRLQLQRTWKQDVVFQMHVLVQVAFECLELLQAHSICRARAVRHRVSGRQRADARHRVAG